MFDTILVHSNTLTPEHELSKECRTRMDTALRLYGNGLASTVFMNGGPGQYSIGGFIERRPFQCDCMSDYAHVHGVPLDDIFKQDFSRDTVGEVYFGYKQVLEPKNLRKVLVVTSTYHIPRTREITQALLGDSVQFEFVASPDEKDLDQKTQEHEIASLSIFLEQFAGVIPKDFSAIEKRLYERHGLYRNLEKKLTYYG